MNSNSGKSPRILGRNANGFFDPNPKEPADLKDAKYIKNPETGIYERNYQASVGGFSRNSSTRREESSSSRREESTRREKETGRRVRSPEGIHSTRPSSPISSRRPSSPSSSRRPSSPSASGRRQEAKPMFDDMLKGLDEISKSSQPISDRRRNERDVDSRRRPDVDSRQPRERESRQNSSNNSQNSDYKSYESNFDDMVASRRSQGVRKSPEPERSTRLPIDRERPPRRPSDTERERLSRRNTEEKQERLSRRQVDESQENNSRRPSRNNAGATGSPPSRRGRSSSRKRESPKEEEFQVPEEELLEFEKQKRDLQKMRDAQKAADKREAEQVAKEREKRTMADGGRRSSSSAEFSLISSSRVEESILVPDYLNALMTTLRQDDTISPVPEDFTDRAAYAAWRRDMRRSFQEVLIKMIKYRFLQPPEPSKPAFEPIQFRLRVIEAKGLIQKEGRSRDAFCKIEYGDFSSQSKSKTKRVLFAVDFRINTRPMWFKERRILGGIRPFQLKYSI